MNNPEISEQGNKRWFNTAGDLHRLDGPAVEFTDGAKSWYVNGQYHRLDGPALKWPNRNSWYINDQQLTEADWNVHPIRIEYVIRENLKSILND